MCKSEYFDEPYPLMKLVRNRINVTNSIKTPILKKLELQGTTFVPFILGSGYLGDCCSRNIRIVWPQKTRRWLISDNFVTNFQNTRRCDANDPSYPGHQVPRRPLLSRYSCSPTSNTTGVTSSANFISKYHKTSEEDVDTIHPGTRYSGGQYLLKHLYKCIDHIML